MHHHIRQLLTILSIALLLAGYTHGSIASGGFDACSPDAICTLGEKLQLFPGEPTRAAVLMGNGQCAKLALPDGFYTDPLRKFWNNQIVEVKGRAFAQPNTQTDLGVLSWLSEQDRKLATGMCHRGLGIYVEALRSASGQTWPGSR